MKFTKRERDLMWALAEKCAGVSPGEKIGRWTHEDRVAICYAVIYKLISINKKERKKYVNKR
jgi:hypothetical protein